MTHELREVVKGDLLALLTVLTEEIEEWDLFSEIQKQWRRHLLAPPSPMQIRVLLYQLRKEGKVKCRGTYYRVMWRLTECVTTKASAVTRFQPNPRKYQTNAARQKAYRERLRAKQASAGQNQSAKTG